MPKNPDLVNKKPTDDVPFGDEQNGDSTAPAAARQPDESKQWDDRGVAELKVTELNARVLELEAELDAAEEQVLSLKQEVEQYKADPGDESGPNVKLQCFMSILSGLAYHGELSIGAVKSDENVRNLMKHAAGMASFAEIAAKKL